MIIFLPVSKQLLKSTWGHAPPSRNIQYVFSWRKIGPWQLLDSQKFILFKSKRDTCRDGTSGGLGGCGPPNILLAPRQHLNFHASSALRNIRDLFFSLFKQYLRHCLQRFLDTAHCQHFDSSSPQQLFSGAITGYLEPPEKQHSSVWPWVCPTICTSIN